jgi:hypothetical protein
MATVWWWIVPESEANAGTRPQDAKLISTPDSGDEYNTLVLGGNYKGITRFQGPFTSKADAQKANPSGGSLADQISAGIGAGLQTDVGVLGAASRAANAVSNPMQGLADIGNFFHALTEKGTWIRVAEFGVGAILLYVGIKAATGGGSPTQSARSGAKRSGGIVRKAASKSAPGRAIAVRKAGKERAQRIVYRRDVKERTGTELMRIKRRRGIAPK